MPPNLPCLLAVTHVGHHFVENIHEFCGADLHVSWGEKLGMGQGSDCKGLRCDEGGWEVWDCHGGYVHVKGSPREGMEGLRMGLGPLFTYISSQLGKKPPGTAGPPHSHWPRCWSNVCEGCRGGDFRAGRGKCPGGTAMRWESLSKAGR